MYFPAISFPMGRGTPKSVVNVVCCFPFISVVGSSSAIMLLKILMQLLGLKCGSAMPRPLPMQSCMQRSAPWLGVILQPGLSGSDSGILRLFCFWSCFCCWYCCTVANCCHFPYPIHWSVRFQRLPEVCSAWLGLHFPAICAVFCLLFCPDTNIYIYIDIQMRDGSRVSGVWSQERTSPCHFLWPVLCKCIFMFLLWLILKVYKYLVLKSKMKNFFSFICYPSKETIPKIPRSYSCSCCCCCCLCLCVCTLSKC